MNNNPNTLQGLLPSYDAQSGLDSMDAGGAQARNIYDGAAYNYNPSYFWKDTGRPGEKQVYSTQRNQSYDFAKVDGFNNPLYVDRSTGNTLSSLLGARQNVFDQTQQSFGAQADQAFGTSAAGYSGGLNGLQINGTGRQQLLDQLEAQFGPGYHTNEQAQAILKNFDSLSSQSEDLGTLNSLIKSGKQVSDYLSSNMNGTTSQGGNAIFHNSEELAQLSKQFGNIDNPP